MSSNEVINKKVLRRFLLLIVIGFVLYVLYSFFDKPINTGVRVKGEVISIGATKDSYKSLSAAKIATIKLENGVVVVKRYGFGDVKHGQIVYLSEYERRITGRKVYH